MKDLINMINEKGEVIEGSILNVDRFLNHEIDLGLMDKIAVEFHQRFKNESITKIVTIETSGIAPAVMTGLKFNVPVVIARKKKAITMDEHVYHEQVYSFTKQEYTDITISKEALSDNDNILIIDDFLANGEAAFGLAKMIQDAGATLSGIGIIIEKSYQLGRTKLINEGYKVESLVRIASMIDGKIDFIVNQEV